MGDARTRTSSRVGQCTSPRSPAADSTLSALTFQIIRLAVSIAERLGRTPATIKTYLYEPDGANARHLKDTYPDCAPRAEPQPAARGRVAPGRVTPAATGTRAASGRTS
jgi:hypothetical protein